LLVLEVEQIALLRSDQRYTQVVALDGRSLLLRSSLADLLPQLDATLFWQVHRGAVINARAIASVERDAMGELRVHLRGLAAAVAVSRTQRGRFRGM
jgi:DNA-binding LytR/AlgR family response regulator